MEKVRSKQGVTELIRSVSGRQITPSKHAFGLGPDDGRILLTRDVVVAVSNGVPAAEEVLLTDLEELSPEGTIALWDRG